MDDATRKPIRSVHAPATPLAVDVFPSTFYSLDPLAEDLPDHDRVGVREPFTKGPQVVGCACRLPLDALAVLESLRVLERKAALERDSDGLFRRRTGVADLNQALRRIHEKRNGLLSVLERPEIPLHKSLSESDIRERSKKRTVNTPARCR